MKEREPERLESGRRANGVRINRRPRRSFRLVKNYQRRLKGRGPINGGGGQTDLRSSPMITAALLIELSCNSKRMKVEREKGNSQEKDRPDQAAGFKSFFHRVKKLPILITRPKLFCQDKPTPG